MTDVVEIGSTPMTVVVEQVVVNPVDISQEAEQLVVQQQTVTVISLAAQGPEGAQGVQGIQGETGPAGSTEISGIEGLQSALDGKQPTLIKQAIAEFIPTNLVWTGTTAPSGATLHQHSFVDCGGFVTGFVRLSWANTGSGLTRVTFDLPSEWPTPDFGDLPLVADGRYFTEWGRMVNSVTANSGSAGRTFLMRNSENTGWLIEVLTGSGSHSIAEANIRYWS